MKALAGDWLGILTKKNYPFLIGGENWAFEVSEREWKILVQIINELIDQHQSLKKSIDARGIYFS